MDPWRKIMKKRNIQKFTLIEVLIVVGIASLLFALAGPAFNRMTRGNMVERHASGLKLGMERARAIAISSRRHTAILLPDQVPETSRTTDARYKFQRGGYRLAHVTMTGNGSYAWQSWIPDSDWTNNGRQEAFLMDITKGTANSSKVKETSTDMVEDADYTKQISGADLLYDVSVPGMGNCRAVIFTPFGDAKFAADSVEIKFYITGINIADHLVIRLNKLTGKVEFVE